MNILYNEERVPIANRKIDELKAAIENKPDGSMADITYGGGYPETKTALESKSPFDIVISEFRVVGEKHGMFGGLDILELTRQTNPEAQFFFMTNHDVSFICDEAERCGLHISPDHIFSKSVPLLQIINYAEHLRSLEIRPDMFARADALMPSGVTAPP